jgi:hypothetical protein
LSWIEKKKQPAFEIFLIEFNFNAFQITWKLGVIIFGSVLFLSKKVTKPKFLFFKKTETGSNRPVSVRFGFLGKKPVQTGLARFFSVFSVLARFFSGFFSISVRFGFFSFLLIKPKPN